MKKEESWMVTYTGKKFYPYDPDIYQIDPIDIAHALSHLCRYNGHSEIFYSVAQHSLNTSYILKDLGYNVEYQLYALLHDASEAYITDLPRPFKIFLDGYKEVEDNVQSVILERFGLGKPDDDIEEIVKRADNEMLYWEGKAFTSNVDKWAYDFKSIPNYILNPNLLVEKPFEQVKSEFLNRLNWLLSHVVLLNELNRLKNGLKKFE